MNFLVFLLYYCLSTLVIFIPIISIIYFIYKRKIAKISNPLEKGIVGFFNNYDNDFEILKEDSKNDDTLDR